MSDEGPSRPPLAPGDPQFDLYDGEGLRWRSLAAELADDPVGRAALDALGRGAPPTIDRRRMDDVVACLTHTYALNYLADITRPDRLFVEQVRVRIYWLCYDAVVRADIVPDRITIEQKLEVRRRELAAREHFHRDFVTTITQTERRFGHPDRLRSLAAFYADERASDARERELLDQALAEGPAYPEILGVKALTHRDKKTLRSAGCGSAIGAVATIMPGLIKRSRPIRGRTPRDPPIADLMTQLFGTEVTARAVVHRRAEFCEQRGITPGRD